MRVTRIALAVCVILAGCGKDRSGEPQTAGRSVAGVPLPPPVTDPVTILEGAKACRIVPPIQITGVGYVKDGGTTGVTARDAVGTEFRFCFDGRLSSSTPCRVYFGAAHPTSPVAELVPENDPDETTILGLIVGWLDANFSVKKQARLLKREKVTGLADRDLWGLRILQALRGQENVRKSRRWLDANYTPEEQQRLLELDAPEGLSRRDSAAWHRVQAQHGYPADERRKGGR